MKFDWANQTAVHPIGLAALVVLGLLTLILPRRYAAVPMLVMACMIPSRQRIVILELDWTFLRLLVLAGWLRVFVRGDPKSLKWIPLDTCVVALSSVILVASTLRTGSTDVLVRSLGVAFDEIGTYLLFRVWIRNWRDIEVVIRSLIAISVPVTLAMTFEHLTTRNLFHVFGGVPEFTLIRQGKLRCQGAFSHPILAGCFYASLLPLFAAQAFQKRSGAAWAAVGVVTSLACIYYSASSTPVMGAATVVLGGALFLVRDWMRPIRWALLGVLVSLHLVMQAPVWHLISRIDVVGGSTGWHRYILIDRAINRFGEWFLLGVSSTRHWGYGMQDVTNEYVLRGVNGGFLALVLFVALLALGFQSAGRIWRSERKIRARVVLAWALGVSLLSHVMMFLAVSYFGQIGIVFSLLLAMLGSLGSRVRVRSPRRLPSKAKPAEGPRPTPPLPGSSLGKELPPRERARVG